MSVDVLGLAVVLFVAYLDSRAPHAPTGHLKGNDSHSKEATRV